MGPHELSSIVWRKSTVSNGADACVEVGWRKSTFSNGASACVEVGWRKSSFSASNGDCVEVGWQKSSFSGGDGACVEVAVGQPTVAVRDSKAPAGPALAFGHPAWHAFLAARRSR